MPNLPDGQMKTSRMTRSSHAAGRLFLIALLATPSFLGASHHASSRPRALDLARRADATVIGGAKVASAGDVNGDGFTDILVGHGDVGIEPTTGFVHVVYGPVPRGDIVLSELGEDGYRIEGADKHDWASEATGVGDVNGDGLDDILVGAAGAAITEERGDSGMAYVVFGARERRDVDLWFFDHGLQANQGYRIEGPGLNTIAGEDVAPAGDVNRDGLADLMISAPFGGATYIVFGKMTTEPVDLRDFHREPPARLIGDPPPKPQGYVIETASPSYNNGYSIANAGDVNGDGTPDAVVGVINTLGGRGRVFVVFGRARSGPVDVEDLGHRGFEILGRFSGSRTADSVAGLGDSNGDGLSDLAVGAPSCCGPGSAFVIFGKKDSRIVNLRRLKTKGYEIKESPQRGDLGSDVAAVGDVDHDGMSDLLVGAASAPVNGENSGAAYVVYGRRSSQSVNVLKMRTSRGFALHGSSGDFAGANVAGTADLDGDGNRDLMVGGLFSPVSYVVWSKPGSR